MKRYLLDDSTQIPRLLFPSVCCLFAALALGVLALVMGSQNWFRSAADLFYPEAPTPAPHEMTTDAYGYTSVNPPWTAEEEAMWDASNARWRKVVRTGKVMIWVTISVAGLFLVTGYVLNAMAWRKLKGQPVTEGVACLSLMWFNLVCLGFAGTLFGRIAMRAKPETLIPVLVMLALATIAGYRYYGRMTKPGEDRIVLRWPRIWNTKLTVILLLPLLPLTLLVFR